MSPGSKSGILALVGSGEYLPAMAPVDRALMAHLGEPARVVCLPTAAGTEGDERIAYWSDLGVRYFIGLGAEARAVRVVDRRTALDPSLAEEIAWANFVYLSGGKPPYLYQTLQGSPAWEAILGVLTAGGVVAGCSAGAMIFGEVIPGFSLPWPWQKGFGLVKGIALVPHFDEISSGVVLGLRRLLPKRYTLVGVEGNTALACSPAGVEVLGQGGVTVWDAEGKTRYLKAQTPPLPGLSGDL